MRPGRWPGLMPRCLHPFFHPAAILVTLARIFGRCCCRAAAWPALRAGLPSYCVRRSPRPPPTSCHLPRRVSILLVASLEHAIDRSRRAASADRPAAWQRTHPSAAARAVATAPGRLQTRSPLLVATGSPTAGGTDRAAGRVALRADRGWRTSDRASAATQRPPDRCRRRIQKPRPPRQASIKTTVPITMLRMFIVRILPILSDFVRATASVLCHDQCIDVAVEIHKVPRAVFARGP